MSQIKNLELKILKERKEVLIKILNLVDSLYRQCKMNDPENYDELISILIDKLMMKYEKIKFNTIFFPSLGYI